MTTMLTHRHDALAVQLAVAFTEVAVQDYISQGRCVDILLDLYCATEDDVLRRVISDGLNEIRYVNLVRCFEMRACLLLVAALSTPSHDPDFVEMAETSAAAREDRDQQRTRTARHSMTASSQSAWRRRWTQPTTRSPCPWYPQTTNCSIPPTQW